MLWLETLEVRKIHPMIFHNRQKMIMVMVMKIRVVVMVTPSSHASSSPIPVHPLPTIKASLSLWVGLCLHSFRQPFPVLVRFLLADPVWHVAYVENILALAALPFKACPDE